MELPFDFREAEKSFACFNQPSSYIDPDLYEPERIDYEEMLGGKPREQLTAFDFGTSAWGPLCYLTPAAKAYLLPRLMELAAPDSRDKAGDLFMMQFINHFSEGPRHPSLSLLDASQRAVVAHFLEHLASEYGEFVAQECWDDVLAEGIRNWRGV
ncbi:hypothetical protein ACS5PN_15065 [Roseateles sp. NT4]|uniref:hypothetical protein n=1 Tax=Roseateles sp. NT4 TaxID=3453715 RepID=UPI003EE87298